MELTSCKDVCTATFTAVLCRQDVTGCPSTDKWVKTTGHILPNYHSPPIKDAVDAYVIGGSRMHYAKQNKQMQKVKLCRIT